MTAQGVSLFPSHLCTSVQNALALHRSEVSLQNNLRRNLELVLGLRRWDSRQTAGFVDCIEAQSIQGATPKNDFRRKESGGAFKKRIKARQRVQNGLLHEILHTDAAQI